MKNEFILNAPGWKKDLKLRFTSSDIDKLEDFFVLFFTDVIVNKDLPKKELLFAQFDTINKLNNMPLELKQNFWNCFWTETDVDKVVNNVYNILNASTT